MTPWPEGLWWVCRAWVTQVQLKSSSNLKTEFSESLNTIPGLASASR
jgi:hypothetical protein